jgi:carbonic anhydrase/acetyltransferase-like protein (isoleucine patch superfamily)
MPAKVVRPLDEKEQAGLRYWAEKYVTTSRFHKNREAS